MRGSSVTTKLLGKRPTVSYSGARGIGGSVMKRMFAVSAIGIGVFASQPALAETIYLACTLVSESDKNVTHFDVTLNEEAGNAGFVIRETGWSPQKMTAAFTPRDVTFVSPTTLKYSTTIYRVDRTDLRSEEHTSALQSLMRNSYAVLCQ